MITPEQEKWLEHLSDDDHVKIYLFDPCSREIFEKIKKQIQSGLGENIEVVHRGATALGISGQGELDVYIPVSEHDFNSVTILVEKLFGKPKSFYLLERARFVTSVDNTKVEVFVINNKSKSWLDGIKFEEYLRNNPEALDAYKKLKESGDGLSTRKYYRRKIEFINSILKYGGFR